MQASTGSQQSGPAPSRPSPTKLAGPLAGPEAGAPAAATERTTTPAPTRLAPAAKAADLHAAAFRTGGDERAEPLQASALPGVRSLPFQASVPALQQLFPQACALSLQQAAHAVSSAPLPGSAVLAWVRYGEKAQQTLAELVRQRLELADGKPLRLVPALLRHLHGRMADVLEAFQGGVFRRSPARVWRETAPEVALLEAQLRQALPVLQSLHDQLGDLISRVRAAQQALQALDMACMFLMDKVGAHIQPTLAARAGAVLASLALAMEQLQMLTEDQSRLLELMQLVQDGVLLKLPAVLSQLARLNGAAHAPLNETQRLLLTEVVLEFSTFIENHLTP
ncbi:hypothetical protein [Comamonas sp. GB3 AK4-5]|uniref:hypothetical protein n=1 Tax=Comamonas sp. GB3 AK4-5 TaxID=3231487 RepID=UPI00351E8D97